MASKDDTSGIKEYAGGWITERKATDVPTFLKYAYIVIFLGTISYGVYFMNGEAGESDRAALVSQLNQATGHSDVFMYIVALLAAVVAIAVIRFAFSKVHTDD
ncbi:MAG: hypothetical protein JSU96_13055 [Acidobacteriota bacterium]|nr:MAG: hypothetical protein JSU96_13055 [Acidobacteriota bacterium]